MGLLRRDLELLESKKIDLEVWKDKILDIRNSIEQLRMELDLHDESFSVEGFEVEWQNFERMWRGRDNTTTETGQMSEFERLVAEAECDDMNVDNEILEFPRNNYQDARYMQFQIYGPGLEVGFVSKVPGQTTQEMGNRYSQWGKDAISLQIDSQITADLKPFYRIEDQTLEEAPPSQPSDRCG
ncbi:hypothetical protein BKA69DRAFT_1040823 [Paraphysoderma sedebokerense]|nr:hypothetical protein BKA69DRAFT_1040823 [Paraphysoderma sedebokerense]